METNRKKNGREKRRSARVATALPVRWLRAGRPVDAVATDININGLFLRTDTAPIESALMQLEVALPSQTVRFFGVARFVGNTAGGHGIGIEIHLIDEQARMMWNQYYRMLLARASKAPSTPAVAPSTR